MLHVHECPLEKPRMLNKRLKRIHVALAVPSFFHVNDLVILQR